MASIVNLIQKRLSDYLNANMRNNLAEDSPYRPALIRPGRLQEDPEELGISILIREGDFELDAPDQTIVSLEKDNLYGRDTGYSATEIGGGWIWRRKMSCEVNCYFTRLGYDRETAADIATEVFSSLEYWLAQSNQDRVWGVCDDWRECALELVVVGSKMRESGGPPQDFIWRGKVVFDVITTKG